ncbi:MAG: hypothetical protein JO257_21380 [Deltaproteobacteria bacterium]|nr:hypothetical protein [Deltaproteobacteria bacterium]
MLATIDQSTQGIPSDYCFTADLVCYVNAKKTVVPLRACNSDSEVQIPQIDQIDWSKPHGLIYGGPDDPRLVRTRISGEP